jgi:hypothetical protein
MAFNSYRHSAILVMLSKEGVTQGYPFAMLLYGVALTPLARSLREAVPEAPQPWYADNLAIGGQGSSIAKTVKLLMELGPRRGYYPEPSKTLVESFIPALFDEPCDDAKMKAMIPLFALPCRNGGLGIPNPQKTAADLKRQGQGMMFTPYCSTPAENG